ncbi:MAG: hypothetical protein M1816_003491 [Peltula sp. TS41687]|nr:MAG: hypothetical protein M1816_003491 [Peltula sp. TS41687]
MEMNSSRDTTKDFTLPRCLEDARIQTLPSSAYYIPNFITPAEEQSLLDQIQNAPARWINLSRRRLQVYPSRLTANNSLLAAPLPKWLLDPVMMRLQSIPVSCDDGDTAGKHIFASSPHKGANHVLINEYEPGQGIMPHQDGAAYWPVVATVSLTAPIVLDIYGKGDDGHAETQPRWSILQEARR